MRRIAFFTLLLAALAPATVAFGQNYWTPLAGPNGIPLANMAATDNGMVYLFSQNKGVFRSGDDGLTWAPFNDGFTSPAFPYANLVATASGGKVYLADGTNLYRLASGGNSWQEISNNFFDFPDQIFTNPQGYLFVTTLSSEGAVYRSTNQGNTFSTWLPPGTLQGFYYDLACQGGGKNFAFATDFSEWILYKIADNGSQVTPLLQDESEMNDLIYHPSGHLFLGGAMLLHSADDGNSWDTLKILTAGQQPIIYSLETNPAGDLFATTSNGIFISKDLGVTWSPFILPPVKYVSSWKFAFSQNTFFAANLSCEDGALVRSTDNGETWESFENEFFIPNVSAIFKDPGGNLYAKDCHWIRSPDEGYTWEPFLLPNGSKVALLEKNSLGYLFAVSLELDSVFRSTDGGVVWENITPPQGVDYVGWLGASPQNELYLQAEGLFLKSSDHGETWSSIGSPGTNSGSPNFAFHPDGSLFAWQIFDAGVWRSQNGGQSWTQLLPQFDLVLGVHVNSKGDIFVGGYSISQGEEGLYRSTDHLATYQLIHEAPASLIFSDLEGDVFIRSYDGVEYSEDDGATWQTLNQGLPDDWQPNTFYISDDQYIYAGFTGDVIHKTALPVAHPNLVKGNIWFDENENCQHDPGEPPLPGWLVKSASGSEQFVRSTAFDGSFKLSLPTGDHLLNPVIPNDLWKNTCASQGVSVSFSGSGDTAFVDFPIAAAQLCPLLELDLSTPLLRRCFENAYTVKICNRGTAQASGAEVEVTLDSFFIFQSATAPLLAQNGNTYTFGVGDLSVEECRTFKVFVTVSCDASLGQEHCTSAWADQSAACPNLPAAAARECQANIGSFDPNDKTALVNGSPTSDWVHPNTDLEFHVRFQNTGTDTAFNVVVEDQLSPLLDPATFRAGASSHPYDWELSETGKLRFLFNDILLPDSNINEPASHGFVKFAISQKPNVAHGSYVQNQAAIFFDFNQAVLTNLVKLHVGNPNATGERRERYAVIAFPNPFENSTRLKISGLDGQMLRLRLFDARGALQRQVEFFAPEIELKREELASGLYFFSVEKAGRQVGSGKIVVK